MTEITEIHTAPTVVAEVTAPHVAEPVPTITYKGQQVTLKYPLYALEKLQEVGLDITDLSDKVGISELIKFVYAGLICQFPDVTLDDIRMAYDLSDIEQLSKALEYGIKVKGK